MLPVNWLVRNVAVLVEFASYLVTELLKKTELSFFQRFRVSLLVWKSIRTDGSIDNLSFKKLLERIVSFRACEYNHVDCLISDALIIIITSHRLITRWGRLRFGCIKFAWKFINLIFSKRMFKFNKINTIFRQHSSKVYLTLCIISWIILKIAFEIHNAFGGF